MASSTLTIPTLNTKRLRLEPLTMQHSNAMYLMWQNRNVQKYSGLATDIHGHEINLPAEQQSDSDKLIHFWMQAAEDGWGFRWAVIQINEQSQFIGHLGFNKVSDCAEIAYHMNPDYWGNGYMTEAAMKAQEWIKSQGSSQVEAFVESENLQSVRLTKRLGLQPTNRFADGAQRYLRKLSL